MTLSEQIIALGSGCVAQLVEPLLPITEVRSSNAVIGKFFIRTKRSERAKQAHSVLREVEKWGIKNFHPYPYRVVG